MATLDELKAAVDAVLQLPVAPILQLNSDTRERAFEAYVFSLVVEAVRRAGGTVVITGAISGPNPDPLVFRGGPGQIGSRAQDFCYADCELGTLAFEIHVDVQYIGTSGATHEVDVSICSTSEADRVRQRPGLWPKASRHLHGAFECKFYDSSLGTGLGRTFVGLVADCGSLKTKSFLTNGRNDALGRYLSHRGPGGFFELSPLKPDITERFIRNVEQALREWAGLL